MSFIDVTSFEQICARANNTLNNGIQLDMSTEESNKFLQRHVNTKTNLVIMIIDINNSTEMSLSLPERQVCL